MKKILSIFLVLLVLQGTFVAGASYEGVWKETRTVTYTGGKKTVTIVWADTKNERIRIDSVLAKGDVGKTDDLKDIVESATDADGEAIAGINGTFFNAYSDFQPLGTLIRDGKTIHVGNTGSVLVVDDYGSVHMDPLYIKVTGGTNNQLEWPYNWYSWNINHFYEDAAAIMIFNKDYNGPKPAHTFTAIEVDKNRVTKISVGGFNIPQEGFLVLTKDQTVIDKFEIGKEASFTTNFYENNYGNVADNTRLLDYTDVRSAVGAGPTLVKNGKIVLDGSKEGFKEDKILKDPAQRSLAGITKDGIFGMVSVPGVTMAQLAEIAINLGMIEAINLDGGASSGVYFDNNYVTEPGRNLSNAIVIRLLYNDPIRINLNGQTLFFDSEPYLNKEFSRVLVPLRGIAEALGANVGWDNASSSVTIERYGTLIKLKANSNIVYVNDVEKVMDVPVTIKDERSYVPIRFITEFFGGDVLWKDEIQTVELTVNNTSLLFEEAEALEIAEKYEEAVIIYKEILAMDSSNIVANKKIATILNTLLNLKEESIKFYERVIELDATDFASLSSLAWTYYAVGQTDKAIDAFTNCITLLPDNSTGYYGVGVCYSSYSKQDVENAIKYFELALGKGLTGAGKTFAENYINEHK